VEAEVERLAARGGELTMAEVQAAVARAVADLRDMEGALPATMNLGLVQVNCVKVGRAFWCVQPSLVCEMCYA
jgi:formaldehyde-activating enzyme involved in methanogenesis